MQRVLKDHAANAAAAEDNAESLAMQVKVLQEKLDEMACEGAILQR